MIRDMIPDDNFLLLMFSFYTHIIAQVICTDNDSFFRQRLPMCFVDSPSPFLVLLIGEIKKLDQFPLPDSSRENAGSGTSGIMRFQKGLQIVMEGKTEGFFKRGELRTGQRAGVNPHQLSPSRYLIRLIFWPPQYGQKAGAWEAASEERAMNR